MNVETKFKDTMLPFLSLVSKRLPDDVMTRLRQMQTQEDSPLQKEIYDTMFENLQLAVEKDKPCCQDTGLLHFYIKAGAEFPYLGRLEGWLSDCVRIATKQIPLRPNTVNFFEEKISDDGIGERIPWIHWEIVPDSDAAEITAYFGGGGCCFPGQAKVFTPSQGYAAIPEFLFEVVTKKGLNACPPVIIGVGLGENIENAAVLSKIACLRELGTSHPNPRGAEMERMLLEKVNSLGIGAQGMRGKQYALAVHVESSGRHTATFAVAISLACYVHRRGIIRFDKNLNYRLKHYEGVAL